MRRAKQLATLLNPHPAEPGGSGDTYPQDIPLTRAEVDAAIELLENALAMLEEPEVEAHGQGLPGRVSRARRELEDALESCGAGVATRLRRRRPVRMRTGSRRFRHRAQVSGKNQSVPGAVSRKKRGSSPVR